MDSTPAAPDLLPCIATFVAVVEANGFAGAARRLGITRSAASRQVARLEDAWGVKLLRRSTRSLSLTEAGQQAFEHASPIPRLAAAAEAAAADLLRAPRGKLRVTSSVAYGHHVIVPVLGDFRARYPNVEVELVLFDRRVDVVEEGFDLAIRLGAQLPDAMFARKLNDIRYSVCASPSLAGLARVSEPADLEQLPTLRFAGRGPKDPWVFTRGSESVRLLPGGGLSVNTSDALLSLALRGLGVALLPDYVCAPALRRGDIVALLPDWTVQGPFGQSVWALRPDRRSPPKAAAFTDFLAERLQAASGATATG